MPAGISNPALGYAAFCGVKFVGYTAFAFYLSRRYRAAPIRAITKGPDGRVAGDLPCPACGYNLRTLVPSASCPECGVSLAVLFPAGPVARAKGQVNPLIVGAVRTLIGMAFGFGLNQLMMLGPSGNRDAAFIALLIPVRVVEWALLIWLFYDRHWEKRFEAARDITLGVIVSFILDVPAVLGYVIVGGVWIC